MTKTNGRVLRSTAPRFAAFVALTLVTVFAARGSAEASAPAQRGGGGGDAAKAAAVVRAFYEDHFARRQCCFDEAGLKLRRRWFAPALYEAMLREVRKPAPGDEVPYFNGDPFTDSQETPARFSVGRATAGGGRATVNVLLSWVEGRRTYERRTLRVELTKLRGVWKISDIRNPDGSTLRAHLKQAG